MNLWNTKDLPQPPINTYKAVNNKIDIKHLDDVFQEGTTFFDDNKFMYAEYAVLSRIVYRMKQKFRSAKDFKALEKINKALDNYFRMDISRNLKNFKELIPSRYKQATYLPTKDLLDYILVRLQGSVKLMERIVETCRIAAYLLDKRMHTGHFWKIAFITFSIISRVYVLAKYTAKFICAFYNKLIPFSSQLNSTSGWSSRYTFPKDLKEWMNVDWLEIDDEIEIIEMPSEIPDIIHQFFDLVDDDDDVQFCDEYFLIQDDDDEKIERNMKKIGNTNFKNLWELRGFDTREDVGEVIEINDSLQVLDENSFSETLFNDKNDIKPKPKQNDSDINIFKNTHKHDVTISDDSAQVQEEDSNIDVNRGEGVSNFESQQRNSKTFTKADDEETITITIPGTPFVDEEGGEKNEIERKYIIGENEDILIISDKSVKFETRNRNAGIQNSVPQQENSKTLNEIKKETVAITIPDTPLTVKKKRMKKIEKLKKGRNEDKLKPIIDRNVIESDSVISLSDTSFRETTDEKQLTMKKFTQDGSIKLQTSRSPFINTDDRLVETSVPKKPFKRKHDIKQNDSQKNILSGTNSRHIAAISGNTVQFVDSDINIITIPDTPLVVKKEKKMKNEIGKLKMEKNEDKLKPDTDSVIESDEHTVISLLDMSFLETSDKKLAKIKKGKMKKLKHDENINMQGYSFTNTKDTLVENSFSKSPSKRTDHIKQNNSQKNILSGTNEHNATISNNSLEFVASNIDTVIVPDTPLVVKKEKNVLQKLRMEKNKFKCDANFNNNIIDVIEDAAIPLSDTSLRETIVETPVKKKKWEPKKPEQNKGTSTQSSNSFITREHQQLMKKVVKTNQNEGTLEPNTTFNNLNGGKLSKSDRIYKWFKINLNSSNDSFIQNKKLQDQTTKLPETQKADPKFHSTGQVVNSNNPIGQQSSIQSTGTFSTSPRKRKLEPDDENLAVKRLKKAISNTEKAKKKLERRLSKTKENLKKLSSELSVELSPTKVNNTVNTNKIVISNKRRRLQKNKLIRTETESCNNIPKMKPKIISTLESNASSEHALQNINELSPIGSKGINTKKRAKSDKRISMQKNKPMGTETESWSNVPEIKQPKITSRLDTFQNINELSPTGGSKGVKTKKRAKSNKRGSIQKKEPMITETESHSNIPNISPTISGRLESKAISENTWQNTNEQRCLIVESKIINTRKRAKSNKRISMLKNKPMGIETENWNNVPKIISRWESNTSTEQTFQNTNELSPTGGSERTNTKKKAKFKKRRSLQKKEPMRTETETRSSIPNVSPPVTSRLESKAISEHTQQNTKLPMNDSPKTNKKKQKKNNLKK